MLNQENQNKTERKLTNKISRGKKLLLLFSFLLFVVTGALAVYTYFHESNKPSLETTKTKIVENKENEEEKNVQVVSVAEVNQSLKIVPQSDLKDFTVADPRQLKLILTENGQEKDVTKEADWGSKDPSIIYVSNVPENKGEITGQKIGKTTIFAQYKDKGATKDIEVKRAELKIHCEVSKTRAKVGEDIRWIIIFDKMGVPWYEYKISGDGGLNSEHPLAVYQYFQPGKKHSKVWAKDRAGTTAEAECPIITVVK